MRAAPRRRLLLALAPALLLAAACDGPTKPTPPPIIQPNDPPTITSLTIASTRVEVGETVAVTAAVTDTETPVGQLTFQWASSPAGTFAGTGADVTWRPAQDLVTPVLATITLTVMERYTVPLAGGATETREHRISQTASVNVNNSRKETETLALSFLTDFANSDAPPEFCVRNFTDSCQGKAAEYADIVADRAAYRIIASSFYVQNVDLDDSRTHAVIWAPCQFTDRVLKDGTVVSSSGICLMTAVYQLPRWWLCNSNWCNDGSKPCVPSFRGGSSMKRLIEGCP